MWTPEQSMGTPRTLLLMFPLMLGDQVGLTAGAPPHPKGVWWGWGRLSCLGCKLGKKNISWWSWLFVGTRKGLPQKVEIKLETHNCLKYQRMLQLDDLSWSYKIMCPHTFGHIMYFESYMKLLSLKQKVSTLVSEQRW